MKGPIGERIRWLVETHLGITQSEFARRLGVKQPQMSRWIKDATRPPNESSIQAIADKAGVPPAWVRYGVAEIAPGVDSEEEEEPEKVEGEKPAGAVREGAAVYSPEPGEFTTKDMQRELRRISDLEDDETVKMMARDSLAAVIRAQWALEQARAAERVADAIIQTDATSRTRELIAEAQRTGRIPTELFRTGPRPAHLDKIPTEPAFAGAPKGGGDSE